MATTSATPAVQAPKFSIFYKELPQAISFLTATGKPVHFYMGYCVAQDKEIIQYCQELDGCENVTGKVDPAKIPTPPVRSRQRNWSSASKTEITPAELLQRVVSSAQVPQAAQSNS